MEGGNILRHVLNLASQRREKVKQSNAKQGPDMCSNMKWIGRYVEFMNGLKDMKNLRE